MKVSQYLRFSLLFVFVLTIGQNAIAWNAKYVNDSSQLQSMKKGHNWIVNKSLELLRERGLLYTIEKGKEKYIHYGVTFADEPWLGRPDNPDGLVRGLHFRKTELYDLECPEGTEWRELYSATQPEIDIPSGDTNYPGDVNANNNVCCYDGSKCVNTLLIPNGHYQYLPVAEKTYDTSTRGGQTGSINTETSYSPRLGGNGNYYLKGAWKGYSPGVVDEQRTFAGDNLFHYYNDTPVQIRPLDGNILEDWFVEGSETYRRGTVGATAYGAMLFQLARKFWPYNFTARPSLSELEFASNYSGPWKTGQTAVEHPTLGMVTAYIPSTYLGGMPFTCDPDESFFPAFESYEADMCLYGSPSWPIFVPLRYDVEEEMPNTAISDGDGSFVTPGVIIDENGVSPQAYFYAKQVRDVEKFHAELIKERPSKSQTAALAYLGWAMHMIQDMGMPHHAVNWTGPSHSFIEDVADELITYAEPTIFDARFYREINEIFGSRYKPKNRNQVCEELGLGRKTLKNGSLQWEAVAGIFEETASLSEDNLYESPLSLLLSYHGYDYEKIWAMLGRWKSNPSEFYNNDFRNTRGEEKLRRSLQIAVMGSMKLAACIEPYLSLGNIGGF